MEPNSYKLSKFKEDYPKLTPLLGAIFQNSLVLLVYFCSNFGSSDDFSQFLEKLSGFTLENQLKVILFREDEIKVSNMKILTNFYLKCMEFHQNNNHLGVNDNARAVVEAILGDRLDVLVLDIDPILTDFEKLLQIESNLLQAEIMGNEWKNTFGRFYLSINE